ncbi:hypothetical protein H0266_10795 [Halobacillus locisalis]|uniref:Uncharacterized protein n=1 Tax=Halobacillus locisalis TaxID=220753 RepID=A0A838CTX7_9BACI|nr:hypothetical protein [Halobacillus locisalis]MBA2175381.1 hypothetical protein [Halobacillus locisalis]
MSHNGHGTITYKHNVEETLRSANLYTWKLKYSDDKRFSLLLKMGQLVAAK